MSSTIKWFPSFLILLTACNRDTSSIAELRIGFIEFRYGGKNYRIDALEHFTAYTRVNSSANSHYLHMHFHDSNDRGVDMDLLIRYQGDLSVTNYEFSAENSDSKTFFDFDVESTGELFLQSIDNSTHGNLRLTRFDAKPHGLVEGTFTISNLRVTEGALLEKGGKLLSESGQVTEGKFSITLDEDWQY